MAMLSSPDLAFLRGVFAASADCIKLIDDQGRLCEMNANGLALLEIVDFAALQGAPWDSLWPEPGASQVRQAVALGLQGGSSRFEAFCPTAAGTPKWWDVQVQPLPPDQACASFRLVSVSRDITDRVHAATAQARLLEEKQLLLQEVHHRVKNSLQLVQSMLLLQARASRGEAAAAQLTSSALRVRSIAGVHERLYRSAGELAVSITEYLHGLTEDLRTTMLEQAPDRRILLQVEGGGTWPANDVPALGLVLTELVTNAVKYGRGDIRIGFAEAGGRATVTVEDAGAPPASLTAGKGLGMRLVEGLLQGCGGSVALDPASPTTRVRVEMPRPAA